MLDTYRIKIRIAEIRKRLNILHRDFKGIPEDQMVKDEALNAAAERHLQIAIQACIDIANHIIAALGLEKPYSPNILKNFWKNKRGQRAKH